jgi:hypothetical protein
LVREELSVAALQATTQAEPDNATAWALLAYARRLRAAPEELSHSWELDPARQRALALLPDKDTRPTLRRLLEPGASWRLGDRNYVSVPAVPFDQCTAFTIEAWVWNWQGMLLSQGVAGDPENAIVMSLGLVTGWESGAGENHWVRTEPGRASDWDHVALVFDGTHQRLFLNGELKHTLPAPQPGPLTPGRRLLIGAEAHNNHVLLGSGHIAGLRISDVARHLSAFTPPAELTTDFNTMLLFDFARTDGKRVEDLSGNGRHGERIGSGSVLVR